MRTGERPAPASAAAIHALITAAAAAANTPNVTHVVARTRTSTTRLAMRSIGRRQCFHSVTSAARSGARSEEHTSELQSLAYLVCRLLLEKKKYPLLLEKHKAH